MMVMLQRTFGSLVGIEALLPIAHHPDDWVVCEDTEQWARRADCISAVDGSNWALTEARNEHEESLVKDYFDGVSEWCNEYRASSDCVDEYAYLVWEDMHDLKGRIRAALEYELEDCKDFDFLTDEVVGDFCKVLEDHVDCAAVTGWNAPDGMGVVFDSFDFGESEEQIDLDNVDVLIKLHERGDLEGYLDSLDRDFCFYRASQAVYDDDGKFVSRVDGPIIQTNCDGKYPCVSFTINTELWYYYGCSSETFREAWNEFAEENDISVSA